MKIQFWVTGMTCAACSARVEKVSGAVDGVEKAEVNLLKGTMVVEAEDASVIGPVIAAVQQAGYNAGTDNGENQYVQPAGDPLHEMKNRIIGSGICLVVLMYFTMGHMFYLPMPNWYHGIENAVVAALLQLLLTMTSPMATLHR